MFAFNKTKTRVESAYANLKTALDTFVNEMAASDVAAESIAENLHKFTGLTIQECQRFATAVCRVRCQEEASGKRPVVPWGRPTETRPAALSGVERR